MKRAAITLPLIVLAGNSGAVIATVTPDVAPTSSQAATIARALPKAYTGAAFTVGTADLNGDRKPDLIVQFTGSDWCSPTGQGCAGTVILSTANGYAAHDTPLPMFGATVNVLPSKHNGLNDLRFDDAGPIFSFDGKGYNRLKP